MWPWFSIANHGHIGPSGAKVLSVIVASEIYYVFGRIKGKLRNFGGIGITWTPQPLHPPTLFLRMSRKRVFDFSILVYKEKHIILAFFC